MNQKISIDKLSVDAQLHEFVEQEVIPRSGISQQQFWQTLQDIIVTLGEENQALLNKRDDFQQQIDQWHREQSGEFNFDLYKQFLIDIGYIVADCDDFKINTQNVDEEIAHIAGPQLVVPIDNARYLLSAANSRWNSLYDALYRTDVIPEVKGCKKSAHYNPVRGQQVIQYVRDFLDKVVPLALGSHHYAVAYKVRCGQLIIVMGDGSETELAWREGFMGYRGDEDSPSNILLRHHFLHIELLIGEGSYIGKGDLAHIKDIRLESTLSTIADCEDSVAAVDAADKVNVYRNWLGLMKGDLTATISKNGKTKQRGLHVDPEYTSPQGESFRLKGRSLMFVRTVGSHMMTDMVLYNEQQVPETFIDAIVVVLAALHDLNGNSSFQNSKTNSIYIVKPKMHGPDEVQAAVKLFSLIEQHFKLPANTIKIGIMDEERRTSVNLHACIKAASERVVFINTGFLDRTGDEIHTSMEADAIVPRSAIKKSRWLLAYEDWNVDMGIKTGFMGVGQIGKGMWAAPDSMNAMLEQKIAHPRAGANTAWVPSPTASTLHAMHYHLVDVYARQLKIARHKRAHLDDLLCIPALGDLELKDSDIINEIENNAQSILGYVVRWINSGIGCSKVPDINDLALMEDRATLRISSQYLANWLHHGVISEDQIHRVFQQMAVVVDKQNMNDPYYQNLSPNVEDSIAYQAALALVFKGRESANGYTETILHEYRRKMKEQF